MVFENDKSVVCGVQSHKFSRVLEGQSSVFGVKFRPGGFRPFSDAPVSKLRDRIIPAKRFFGKDVEALKAVVLSSRKEQAKVEAANAFFRSRMPAPDKTIDLAGQLVERILRLTESDLCPEIRNEASHEIHSQFLSTRKAREILDWKPLYSLDQGLRLTVDWYRQFIASETVTGRSGGSA